MNNGTSPAALMQAHVDLQLGTYFSDVHELKSGGRFASSSRISDYYWNYAYDLNCSPQELPNCVAEIRAYAAKIARQPTIYVTPDTNPQHVRDVLALKETSTEVWMTLSRENLQRVTIPTGLRIAPATSVEDIESFIHVFRDAYGSGAPDSPGYSGLPEEYPESIRSAEPPLGVQVTNFIGWEGDTPVAISTIFCNPPYAGLYSVGTAHQVRRKRYGTVMSFVAIERALLTGCNVVFLQTEADSPVEELYKKLGFSREFLGEFLILN